MRLFRSRQAQIFMATSSKPALITAAMLEVAANSPLKKDVHNNPKRKFWCCASCSFSPQNQRVWTLNLGEKVRMRGLPFLS